MLRQWRPVGRGMPAAVGAASWAAL